MAKYYKNRTSIKPIGDFFQGLFALSLNLTLAYKDGRIVE